ncbi:MAG: alpha/beta fold hydrolase, partial [Bacteroidetes bacterium]|nr:alpha/beta fold hydrolase [Bacteroidota bacterium]
MTTVGRSGAACSASQVPYAPTNRPITSGSSPCPTIPRIPETDIINVFSRINKTDKYKIADHFLTKGRLTLSLVLIPRLQRPFSSIHPTQEKRQFPAPNAIAPSMIPIRHETSSYTNRDLQLFFRTWTPREQSPKYTVLLLHGWGDHSGRYMHVGQALARAGAMVLAPDLAGHGRSPGPRGLIRKWHHLVQDMEALLTHVGVTEPCAAFGHSMGGLLALTLADALPKRIKSLVLSSPLVV